MKIAILPAVHAKPRICLVRLGVGVTVIRGIPDGQPNGCGRRDEGVGLREGRASSASGFVREGPAPGVPRNGTAVPGVNRALTGYGNYRAVDFALLGFTKPSDAFVPKIRRTCVNMICEDQ